MPHKLLKRLKSGVAEVKEGLPLARKGIRGIVSRRAASSRLKRATQNKKVRARNLRFMRESGYKNVEEGLRGAGFTEKQIRRAKKD